MGKVCVPVCRRHRVRPFFPVAESGRDGLEATVARLLEGTAWAMHRWHALKRGGAAACSHCKLYVGHLIWRGRWHCLQTVLEYALHFMDLYGLVPFSVVEALHQVFCGNS